MIRGKNMQFGTPSALIMVFASEPIKVGGTSEVASKPSGTTVGSTVTASDPAVVAASSAMKPSGTTVGSTVAFDPVMEPATVVASSPVFNSILLGPSCFNAERKPWTDNPVEFMG